MPFFIYSDWTSAQAKHFTVTFIYLKDFLYSVFMTPDDFALAYLKILPEFSTARGTLKCQH
jgi:hypothetical protein